MSSCNSGDAQLFLSDNVNLELSVITLCPATTNDGVSSAKGNAIELTDVLK